MPIYAIAMLTAFGAVATLVLLLTSLMFALTGTSGAWTAALVGGALLLWTLAIGAVGVVGLYVIRIYKDVRRRPQYIVADSAGIEARDIEHEHAGTLPQ